MPEEPSSPAGALPFAELVNRVGFEAPFAWLAAGWRDFRQAGFISVAHGLIFVVAGFVLTAGLHFFRLDYLIGPLIAGFMLVGPALTVGFYAISRDLENGQPPSLRRSLTAWRANPRQLAVLGLALVIFLIIWLRIAVLIFAVSFPHRAPDMAKLMPVAMSSEGITFLVVGTLVGAGLATVAFATGAMSLPMLLDRRVDALQGVVTSVVAVLMNARVMAVWAALIVAITAAGMAIAYVGLAVTLPVIGHASWHAYRAVIRREGS